MCLFVFYLYHNKYKNTFVRNSYYIRSDVIEGVTNNPGLHHSTISVPQNLAETKKNSFLFEQTTNERMKQDKNKERRRKKTAHPVAWRYGTVQFFCLSFGLRLFLFFLENLSHKINRLYNK